jgi:hypothetical protein
LGLLLPWSIFILTKDKMFFADQASVCVIAHGILNHLDMYRHFFNEKFPVLYYHAAFFLKYFGDDINGVRILAYATFSLTFAILYYLIAQHIKKGFLRIFYISLIFLFFIYTKTYNAATEPSLALLYLTVILFITNMKHKYLPMQHLIVGMLMGIALGFRQHALLPALLLFIFPWHRISRVYYLIGLLTSVGLWLSYFIYQGLFDDLVSSTILIAFKNPHASSYILPTGFLKLAFIIVMILFFHVLYLTRKNHKTYLAFFAIACSLPFFIRFGNTRLWPAFVILCALIFIYKKDTTPDRFLFGSKYSVKYWGVILLITLIPYRFYKEWKNSLPYHTDPLLAYIDSRFDYHESLIFLPGSAVDYCLTHHIPATKYYFIQPWFEDEAMKKTISNDIGSKKAISIIIRKEFERNPNYLDINKVINDYYHIDREAHFSDVDIFLRND